MRALFSLWCSGSVILPLLYLSLFTVCCGASPVSEHVVLVRLARGLGALVMSRLPFPWAFRRGLGPLVSDSASPQGGCLRTSRPLLFPFTPAFSSPPFFLPQFSTLSASDSHFQLSFHLVLSFSLFFFTHFLSLHHSYLSIIPLFLQFLVRGTLRSNLGLINKAFFIPLCICGL